MAFSGWGPRILNILQYVGQSCIKKNWHTQNVKSTSVGKYWKETPQTGSISLSLHHLLIIYQHIPSLQRSRKKHLEETVPFLHSLVLEQ